jgi:glycolate oxidase iron-sulfur subunit
LTAPLPVVTAAPPPDRATEPSNGNGNGQREHHGHALGFGIDPRAYDRGLACVHCGLCLPACPTYTQTGHEAESPRGRIQLMLGLAEGKIEATPAVRQHLDLCLDCRGCETVCPSGVVYHELLEDTRSRLHVGSGAEELRHGSRQERFMQWLFFNVFVYPTRLKLALLPARMLQKAGLYGLLRKTGILKLLPSQLRKMEQMLPPTGPLWPRRLPAQTPASGAATKRVGFFAGCIGSVMFDRVNRQAVDLLRVAGATVLAPPEQSCCGAIHHHNGAHGPAEAFARHNIDTFLPKVGPAVDFIATNIAGCGAMLREYDVLLRDDPAYAARAKEFVRRVRDISEVLLALGLDKKTEHPVRETVTYHDACHLAHAQKVTAPPRALLAAIPGLKLVPLPESDICCGAAGTYNLTQPEMATELAARKLKNIASTGTATCVTGNVGCAMHISSEAAARGQPLRVVHPVELLHRSVFGGRSPSL